VQELNGIKDSIVIFKLLIDDKQSEAINIYLNLIELINSKKELIINKINTYPQNYFDNELNKSAIITYVKNMLYKNIFHNYLLNIIPRIDVNNLIKETDKDAIENIIKSLLHLNHNSDERVLKDTMLKIEKYNDILKTTIKTNCNDYETLKKIIGKYIETAWGAVNDAINEPKEAEEEAATEGAAAEEEAAATEEEAAEGAEEEAKGAAAEGAEGAAEEGAEDKEKKGNGNTEKKKDKKKKPDNKEDDIKKVIDEEMIAIKEGLDNLENKDYVDKLLPVLEKESEYYEMFINSDDSVFDNDELWQYFNNISKFLKDYKELYDIYINNMKKELDEKKTDESNKLKCIELNKKAIDGEEEKLEILKIELQEKNAKLLAIKKKIEEEEGGGDQPEEEGDQNNNQTAAPVSVLVPVTGGYKGRSKGVAKGGSKRCKIYRRVARIAGGEGEEAEESKAVGEAGEAEEAGEAMSYEKEENVLKDKIKVLNKEYAKYIGIIRDFKIKRNDLKKELDKIKKKIEAIEKKIKQYDMNNNLLNEYTSISDASRKTSIQRKIISFKISHIQIQLCFLYHCIPVG
jgi:hypothetical protein